MTEPTPPPPCESPCGRRQKVCRGLRINGSGAVVVHHRRSVSPCAGPCYLFFLLLPSPSIWQTPKVSFQPFVGIHQCFPSALRVTGGTNPLVSPYLQLLCCIVYCLQTVTWCFLGALLSVLLSRKQLLQGDLLPFPSIREWLEAWASPHCGTSLGILPLFLFSFSSLV